MKLCTSISATNISKNRRNNVCRFAKQYILKIRKTIFFKDAHVCFSYRIEHAMEINVLKNTNSNGVSSIFKKIVHAINIHREAMKLV